MPPDAPRPVRRWRAALPWLSQLVLDHLLLLPMGAAIAMVWVNTRPESYYGFTYPIAFAVNDVAMTFFFGLMTKEVVEATAPGGVLHSMAACVDAGDRGDRWIGSHRDRSISSRSTRWRNRLSRSRGRCRSASTLRSPTSSPG